MAWTPKYETKFGLPVAEALLAFIRTNAVEALTWANGGTALKYTRSDGTEADGFAAYYHYPNYNTLFPSIEVFPVEVKIKEAEDEGHLNEAHEFNVLVECNAPDEAEAQRRIFTYVRAVDSMIRAASRRPSISAALVADRYSQVVFTVDEHSYDPPKPGKQSLIQRSATLSVTARFIET